MRTLFALSIAAIAALLSVPSDAVAIPNCRACPYTCNDLGLGKKDCSFLSESKGVCCVDLNQKGLDVANAQKQVLDQQAAAVNTAAQCPAGFQRSEQKCTERERRAGCKDLRLPNGTGCVRR